MDISETNQLSAEICWIEQKKPLSHRFDVRLISLCSRGIQDGMPRELGGDGQSYSFCYYDVIEVQPVELKQGPLLKDAYIQAQMREKTAGLGFQQSLIAVTDISDYSNASGYSQDEINAFWSLEAEKDALFFLTMINLANIEDLDDVLRGIRQKLPKGRHLAYTTFDHCDVIIFCRGNSFQAYANLIFDLYDTGSIKLEDAITLYSFSSRSKLPETGEHFAALIRLGVRDSSSKELFIKSCRS